jgi:hypothetical protein
MGKGDFHVSTVLALIIAAIILIVFAPILIKSAYAVWDKILEALGIVKPSMLEKAVECSYYRCTEGCVKAQEYCKDFYVSACSLPIANGFYEGDFQVCGWNALQYPVELSEDALKDDEKVYTTESFDKIFTCILPAETETGISWGRVAVGTAALGLAGTGCALSLMVGVLPGLVACPVLFTVSALINWAVSYNHLIIDTALIRSSKTGTCTYGIETATSLTEFKVKPSGFFEDHLKPSPTVYIASSKDEGIASKKYTTVVLSMPTYVIIPSDEKEFSFNFTTTDKFLRVKTPEDEIALKVSEVATDHVTVELKSGTDYKSSQLSQTLPSDSIGMKNNYYFYVTLSKIYADQKLVELKLKVTSTSPVQPIAKQPTDGDQWTENQQFLQYWTVDGTSITPERSTDSKVGSYSVKIDMHHASFYRFWPTKAGVSIKPSEYKYIHFYLKSVDNSPTEGGYLVVKFKNTQIYCQWTLGYSNMANKWKEINVDLFTCTETNTYKDYDIDFIELTGFEGTTWIDGLYFFK